MMKKVFLTTLFVLFMNVLAMGDWSPGQPAKWVQLPDPTPLGLDVLATHPKVLADDFLCTSTDWITDIHLWGSWYHDILPINPEGIADPSQIGFRLSLHSDIPADPATNPYSRPGDLLWEKRFLPGDFKVRPYSQGPEGWYNPNTGQMEFESDFVMWQYNFDIKPAEAFQQKGTATDPIVYWLDVEAFPLWQPGTVEPLFGWKTALNHWNDDAVWADTPLGPWQELIYPTPHPYAGQSIDLAFVITPEPVSIVLLALGSAVLLRIRRK